VLLVAVGYYLGGLVGLALRAPPAGIATFWPPNAILLAALLLAPSRFWWWYFLAVLPAHLHLVATFQPGVPLVAALAQYTGNVLQAIMAAVLLHRLGGAPPRFDDLRGVSMYMAIAAIAAPVVASALAVCVLTLTGWVTDFWLAWRQRVLTNVVPALTLTPLIVLTFGNGAALRRVPAARFIEFGLLAVGVTAASDAIFGWRSAGHEALPALLYALLPLLLWAALRFGQLGLSFCLLIVALVSLANAFLGRGPFSAVSTEGNVLALQVFHVAVSVPLMLLAAIVKERRRTEHALRRSQQRYSLATAAGAVGVWDWNLQTNEIYVDPALKAILGFADNEIRNHLEDWGRRVHPEDAARVMSLAQAHIDGTVPFFEVEHRMLHRDGSIRWFLARGMIAVRENGAALRMIGTDSDITERKRAEQALRRSSERIRELAGRLISAQEEERRRIARELHDDLNQKVAALSIAISNMRRQLPPASDSMRNELSRLQTRTNELVNDVRQLSHELHPAALEDAGLVAVLKSFAAELSRLDGIEIDLTVPEDRQPIPHDIAVCMFRVAQESLRNVVKHSGADRAEVALSVGEGAVTLLVRDDGRGFSVGRARQHGGLGLVSIAERVRLLNGRFDVTSRPGSGTTVRVQVPVRKEVASLSAVDSYQSTVHR
jgi:two-component system sensor histidine kinase UhpB